MELQTFITTTLTEIIQGVQEAITAHIKSGSGGAINPSWGGEKEINKSLIEKINFDIAVTVTDQTSGSAKAGIKVVGIEIGGGVNENIQTSNISRIQFSIPIVHPVTLVKATPPVM